MKKRSVLLLVVGLFFCVPIFGMENKKEETEKKEEKEDHGCLTTIMKIAYPDFWDMADDLREVLNNLFNKKESRKGK